MQHRIASMLKPGSRTGNWLAASLLLTYRRELVSIGAFSAFLNILYLGPTLFMLQVYDRVLPSRSPETLLALVLVLLLTITMMFVLDRARQRTLIRVGASLDRFLSSKVLSSLAATSSPPLNVQSLMRDVDALRKTVAGPAMLALCDAPWIIVYLISAFLLNPLLGAFTVAATGMLLVLSLIHIWATRAPAEVAVAASASAALSLSSLTGLGGAVRPLGLEAGLLGAALSKREYATVMQVKATFVASSYLTIIKSARLGVQSLALSVGAWLAIKQYISPGVIFAASLLVARSIAPLDQIISHWSSLVRASKTATMLSALLAPAESSAPKIRLPEACGVIDFRDVTYRSPSGRLLVDNVSFQACPGDVIGIIGPSGAGKSTLVRLLVGQFQPSIGKIRVDGSDLSDWQEEQIRATIGYLSQEPSLVPGTIRENISRFASWEQLKKGNDDLVVAAAQLAGVHDVIVEIPAGYNAEVGAADGNLSVGQAQRVALARALYRTPRVVVLDEPNANLDSDGEAALHTAIKTLQKRACTVLVVTHRPAILELATKILVMQKGRLVQSGDRESVIASQARRFDQTRDHRDNGRVAARGLAA